jgi:hypothetical protein
MYLACEVQQVMLSMYVWKCHTTTPSTTQWVALFGSCGLPQLQQFFKFHRLHSAHE